MLSLKGNIGPHFWIAINLDKFSMDDSISKLRENKNTWRKIKDNKNVKEKISQISFTCSITFTSASHFFPYHVYHSIISIMGLFFQFTL